MTTTKFFHFKGVLKLMFLNSEGANKQPSKSHVGNPKDHVVCTHAAEENFSFTQRKPNTDQNAALWQCPTDLRKIKEVYL